MKSHAFPPCPALDESESSFCLASHATSHLVAFSIMESTCYITILMFKQPLFYLIIAPKGKSMDADNSDKEEL